MASDIEQGTSETPGAPAHDDPMDAALRKIRGGTAASTTRSNAPSIDDALAAIRAQTRGTPAPGPAIGNVDLRTPDRARSSTSSDVEKVEPPTAPKPFRVASVGLTPKPNQPSSPPLPLAPARAASDATTAPKATPIALPKAGIRQQPPAALATSLKSSSPSVGAPVAPQPAAPAPTEQTPDGSTYRRVMAQGAGNDVRRTVTATRDATRTGKDDTPSLAHPSIELGLQQGLSDLAQPDPSQFEPESKLGRAAYAAGAMAAHPVGTATGIVTAPLQAGWTLGRYSRQQLERKVGNAITGDEVSTKDAAFAAGQLLALGAADKILPILDEVFGAQMAKATVKAIREGQSPTKALIAGYAKRTAAHAIVGAGVGATFAPDDPTTGAILGAALGGVHAATQLPHVDVPDGVVDAAAPTAMGPSRQVGGRVQQPPTATVRMAEPVPVATGPDYTVEPLPPEQPASVRTPEQQRFEDRASATLLDALPNGGANGRAPREPAASPMPTAETNRAQNIPESIPGPRELIPESTGRHLTEDQMLTRNIARGLTTGHPDAIDHAAPEMAERVPPNAVLVPLPDHTGSTTANAALADAIANLHGDADVVDVLGRSAQVGNSRELREKGKPGVTADEHEASLTTNGDVPKDRPVVFVDAVETTGAAAEGARRVLNRPDGEIVAFARAPIPAGEQVALPKPASDASSLQRGKPEKISPEAPASADTSTAVSTERTEPVAERPAEPERAVEPRDEQRGEDLPTLDEDRDGRLSESPAGSEGTAASEREVPERASEASPRGTADAESGTGHDVTPLGKRAAVDGPAGKSGEVHFSDGSSIKSKYRVIEADALEASHHPTSFAKNPNYPDGVQGREYAGSRGLAARQHVEAQTGKLRTGPLLDLASGTTDGPPIITPHGIAIAGNQRAMMLRRATSIAPERYAAYRTELESRAKDFGLDPEEIKGMKSPVLVRQLDDPSIDTNDTKTLARLNQLSDQPPTKAKDALSDAMGRAKQMQQAGEALQHFADTIGPDDTVRDYLTTGNGWQFARKLIDDGVISPQERGAFFDADGALTSAGKDAIESALRVAAIGDPDIIHRTPAKILRKLESALPAIIHANATKTYAFSSELQPALELLARVDAMKGAMQARGETVGDFGVKDYLAQQDAFGNQVPEAVSDFATFLERAPKADVTAALREYAKVAALGTDASQSDDLFGYEPETKSGLAGRLLRVGERGSFDSRQLGRWKLVDADGKVIDLAHTPREASVARTPEQSTVADRVVARVKDIGLPDGGERKRQLEEAAKRGLIDPVGRTMKTARDAATLMQAFRHPAMEILHAFVKDAEGNVVGHVMATSGALSWSAVPENFTAEIAKLAKAAGGVEVELGHNHPSGDPKYSGEDLIMTVNLADELAEHALKLTGHTIIDHDKASLIDVDLDAGRLHFSEVTDLPSDGAPWTTAVESGYPFLKSNDQLAEYLFAVHDPGAATLTYVDTQRRVVGIVPKLPEAMTLEQMREWLPNELKVMGAANVIIGAEGELASQIADDVGLAQRSHGPQHEWADDVFDVLAVQTASGDTPAAYTSYAKQGVVQSKPVRIPEDARRHTIRLRSGESADAQVRRAAAPEGADANGRDDTAARESGRVSPADRVGEDTEAPGSAESGDRVSVPDELTSRSLEDWSRAVERQFGLERFDLSLKKNGDIHAAVMVVPRELRGQGIGTQAMTALTDLADVHQRRIVLTPADRGDLDGAGTTSRARLEKFYRRFGFVKNAGRARELTLQDSMYRDPQARAANERAPAADVTRTEAFRLWFGDSKVVDADGNPLVVYHGTQANFDTFRVGSAEGWGKGIYFTDNRQVAADEFGHKGRVIDAYVSLQNPYIDGKTHITDDALEGTAAWQRVKDRFDDARDAWNEDGRFVGDALRELGYDGVIAQGSNSIDGKEIVAFHPEQVKSASANSGWFDRNNPSIVAESAETPFAFGNGEERTTGISNAVNARTRDELGMERRRRVEPRTQQEMYDAGKATADADPSAIPRLLDELRQNPEKIVGTATEAGLLLKHRVDLDNKLKELVAAKDRAVEANDADAERLARLQLAAHREAIREFVDLAERTGTASGRALAARKMMSKLDYSLSHMEAMAESAKGSALDEQELTRIKALHDELVEKLAAAERDLAAANERAAIAEADFHHAQLRVEAMKPLMDKASTRLGSAAEAAKARLRARGLRAMAGLDPTDLADYSIIGAAALAKGVVRFSEWSKAMKASLGDDITPHLKEIFDASNTQLNKELNRARALESRKPPVRKAPQTADMREKMMARLDDGAALRELRPYLRKLALEHIRAGVTGREAVLDALYRDVLATGASATKAQVRDALSGYGDFHPLDKAKDKARLREIHAEAQKLAQLEALKRGEAPLATGFERQAPSDEARRLTKEVNEAKKAAGIRSDIDDATRLRSALAAAKTRIRNTIADLRTEIDTGERLVRGKHVLIGDAELGALRGELAELRKAEAEIFGKKEMTDAQRLELAVKAARRTADMWQDRLDAARKGEFPSAAKRRILGNDEIESLRARAIQARDEYEALKASDPAQQLAAEQRANAQYRANLARREAELLDRLAREDYKPRPLKPGTRLDAESLRRKAEVEDVKQRFHDAVRTFEKANRSTPEKARDAALAFIRAGALSYPSVILKLTSVALSRLVTTPITDLAALGVANALPRLAAGAPRYGARSLRVAIESEAAAQVAMWTEGLADAGRMLTNKQSRLALVHAKNKLPHEWFEYFGSIHAALKEPIKRAEYARALYRLTVEAIERGENTTDEFVKLRLSTEAYLHAERAVAMNDNVVVSAWNDGLRRLERKDPVTGKPNPLGVFLATALRAEMPIVKAPTNVIVDAGEYIAGLPLGAARAAWSYAHGLDDLKPVERDSILRLLSKGLVGMAIMALYFYKHDTIEFGGFYEPGEKRKPDEVPADALRVGTHVIPKNLLHNPVFMAGQFAASIARVAPTRVHPRDEDPVGYGSALTAASVGLLDEVPIVGSLVGDTRQLMDPKTREEFLSKKFASMAVPGVVQWIATQTDSTDAPRKAAGLVQNLQLRTPGLRRSVPLDEKKIRRTERLSQSSTP